MSNDLLGHSFAGLGPNNAPENYRCPRNLSDVGLIDFGKSGFGQISQSFSLYRYGSNRRLRLFPQPIEKSSSNRLSLASESPKSDRLLAFAI
jgi:hypothetical protein